MPQTDTSNLSAIVGIGDKWNGGTDFDKKYHNLSN